MPVLLAVWSYSHHAYAIALADETTGSILHGMAVAMEFFGCVPAEPWWDNPKTVASSILRGRDRQLNFHYASLASHYRFAPMFCLPERGQEKGDVERTVYALERRFATAVPQVNDMDALNRHLLNCCLKERGRTVSGRSRTSHFLATLERKPAYLDHTKLFKELKLPPAFAELRRRLEEEMGSRTGTRRYIRVMQLLGRYTAEQVAGAIEANLHRPNPRAEFIEQKLAATSGNEVLSASPTPGTIKDGGGETTNNESTNRETVTVADAESLPRPIFSASKISPIKLPSVIVPPPDLRRFDQLLMYRSQPQARGQASQGEENVGDVIEAQPQDAAAADHAGRVCPTLA